MEESARLRTSQKAYRSHVTRILNKVEETLANDIDELALTYLKTAMTQLEKKKEQIAAIDQRIIELTQDADELETAILDSEELQDVILEKINELNQRVETLSRQPRVNTTPVVSEHESGEDVTPEASQENASTTTSTPQSINTTPSDTPAVCASAVAVHNTAPITSTTFEPVVPSTSSLTTTLLESAPLSVSSISHPLVTYLHSLGPPPLIPASTDTSILFPQLSSLNLGGQQFTEPCKNTCSNFSIIIGY